MSGGSMNYLYRQVNEVASELRTSRSHARRAFATHLYMVGAVLKAIEWSESADGSEEKAEKMIVACIESRKLPSVTIESIADIEKALKTLKFQAGVAYDSSE